MNKFSVSEERYIELEKMMQFIGAKNEIIYMIASCLSVVINNVKCSLIKTASGEKLYVETNL